jgi:uncharacterized glyoxalase superfamily protein PhnB
MADKVSPVPEGMHTLTPHIVVNDARKAIDFYQKAFGAVVCDVHPMPDGKIMHAAIKIGDSTVMLNDEFPEMGAPSPATTKTDTCVRLHLYVPDADKTFNAAVGAGAKVIMPIADMFWGDRYGQVVDPFGHRWSIATRTKNMTEQEMKAAGEAAMAQMAHSAS